MKHLCILTLSLVFLSACSFTKSVPPEPGTPAYTEQEIAAYAPVVTLGESDARLRIVEFYDVTCGMCRYAHNELFAKLKTEYIDTGKVSFALYDLPLGNSVRSRTLQAALRCAAQQDRYNDYIEIIYKDLKYATEEKIVPYAEQAKLSLHEFTTCIAEGASAQKVQENYELAEKLKLDGTPTFYLNGEQVLGAMPWQSFKELIDARLAP
jgi:protein-disulfide isomerase